MRTILFWQCWKLLLLLLIRQGSGFFTRQRHRPENESRMSNAETVLRSVVLRVRLIRLESVSGRKRSWTWMLVSWWKNTQLVYDEQWIKGEWSRDKIPWDQNWHFSTFCKIDQEIEKAPGALEAQKAQEAQEALEALGVIFQVVFSNLI